MFTNLSDLYRLHEGIKTKRISSYDRSGGNGDLIQIEAGETKTIAEIENAGIIQHIWITMQADDPMLRRNTIIRMYWDGEEHPSVESPIGDFFGQGWGEKYNFVSLPLAAAPREGSSLVSYFPMPFGNGAKVTIENDSEFPIKCFYYYIDYEIHPSLGPEVGRFHAWWNREITAPDTESENEWGSLGPSDYKNPSDKNNYLFADIEGKGQLVGINYFVDNPSPMWYGEGDDMFLIDGEEWPGSLHGTGTEDFFNTSWCPDELYQHPYFGFGKVARKFGWMGRTHCYRFFMQDRIFFSKSLRASIEHGHANCLTLDLSSVAYWYQAEPHKPFPAIHPKGKRQNMPEVDVNAVHRWRHAWRQAGSNAVWGTEKE